MQGIFELDIVLGSGVGHGTPDFCVPERDSQSSVAGPPSCASVTLVPRATLRGVAELHVASGMPQWRMFVTSCYI